jgi:hypothetical protein
MDEVAMSGKLQKELEDAIRSARPLDHIVALLRQYKAQGVNRDEVYAFLESLRDKAADEGEEDRILEVSDFVAGFCAPHMRIWDA